MALHGTTIAIIGGSSGIGLATAIAGQKAGARLVLGGRSKVRLEKARELVGGDASVYSVDSNSEESLHNFFESCGPIDHLFVTAAEAVFSKIEESDEARLRAALDGKYWGAYFAVKYALPFISQKGSITFISGLAAWKGYPGGSSAAASGAAVEALGRTLAMELAPIRVNTISAGFVDTPMLDDALGENKNAALESIAEKLPLKRIGRPEEIAHAALFLMENTYVTGTVLHVDGGAKL